MITFLTKTKKIMLDKIRNGDLDGDIYDHIEECWNDTMSVPQPTGSNIYGFFGCETEDGYHIDYKAMKRPSCAQDAFTKEFKNLIDRIYRLFERNHVEGSKELTVEQKSIWYKCEEAQRHCWERCPFGRTVKVWTEENGSGIKVKFENGDFYHYMLDRGGEPVWY